MSRKISVVKAAAAAIAAAVAVAVGAGAAVSSDANLYKVVSELCYVSLQFHLASHGNACEPFCSTFSGRNQSTKLDPVDAAD